MERTEQEIGRFFNCCETRRQRKLGTRVSRKARLQLIDGLARLGIEGRSVLEVGSGTGELTRRLIELGASKALGLDLADQAVAEASRTASREGMSDKVEYRVANGAKEPLAQHDIVVLEKVICCYPDWRDLVDNTSSAAQHTYGFVLPRSQGPGASLVRLLLAIERLVLRFKKCGFRPYMHDYTKIDSRLKDRGFRRTSLSNGVIWMTAVYEFPRYP